jgi:hypothetical protein
MQMLTVDQRQWIVLSFSNFAKYYLQLTSSDEVEEAVRLRIKQYSLNVGLGFESRLILVDEGYIGRISKTVANKVKGEFGLISKVEVTLQLPLERQQKLPMELLLSIRVSEEEELGK